MLETATQTAVIQLVTQIVSSNGGVVLTLKNGSSAVLPCDHPDRDLLLLQAEGSCRRQIPVGIVLDGAGTVIDLAYATRSFVNAIEDDKSDASRERILFQGYSPLCYLPCDHPEVQRIRSTLTEALASREAVWFANRTWPVEGDIDLWIQIMDVRPAAESDVEDMSGVAD